VPPLAVPAEDAEDTDDRLGCGGVRLFVERLRAAEPHFAPNPRSAAMIAAICRRLDGIPLAIELAAARAAVLSVEEVATHLDDRFRILTGGRRTALPRHQTLRATFDWSYELLSEIERVILRRLGVFAGAFSLDAASTIGASPPEIAPWEVVEGLSRLVAKSLVVAEIGGEAPGYRLLDTTRAYVLEKLIESGEHQQVARRYAYYYRRLFERAEAEWGTRPPDSWKAEYGRHINDLRAAVEWAFSPAGDAEMGIALTVGSVLASSDFVREQIGQVRDVHGRKDGPGVPLHVLLVSAIALLLSLEPIERIKTVLGRVLALARSVGDVQTEIEALRLLWNTHSYRSECDQLETLAEQHSRLTRASGNAYGSFISDRMLGHVLHDKGRLREARTCFEQLLRHYVHPREPSRTLWFVYNQGILASAMLARVLWLEGLADQAVENAKKALEKAVATGHKLTLCWVSTYGVCPVALMTGDLNGAEQAIGTLIRVATDLNSALFLLFGRCLEGILLIARGEFTQGADALRAVLETCDRSGWLVMNVQVLGAFAEAMAGTGQSAEALDAIDRALARAERSAELWNQPELLRIKGEVLHQQGGDQFSAAEDCFRAALELAREQGALSWELRTATSLARFNCSQGRRQEARGLLSCVYNRFTEGFGTADLRTAKSLLHELS
jgi:predicted ATPase